VKPLPSTPPHSAGDFVPFRCDSCGKQEHLWEVDGRLGPLMGVSERSERRRGNGSSPYEDARSASSKHRLCASCLATAVRMTKAGGL